MEENQFNVNDYAAKQLGLKKVDIRTYSPLTLAYIGDAVYEIWIRTLVVNRGNIPVNKLHKKTSSLVKASAQAHMIQEIKKELTEEEVLIYKRGRNAKSATIAKNATVNDYRSATGLEALFGHLYLTGQEKRMLDLLRIGLIRMGELECEKNAQSMCRNGVTT